MNNRSETSNHPIRQLVIPGESGNLDKGAFVCDLIMLGIFIWNQIRYNMDMLFMIIPLALIGLYLFLFCVLAEEYSFAETGLEVWHRFKKTILIPYNAVFNYEASAHDSFINILQNNKVKLYYMQAKKKKTIICKPKDMETFVETLIWNCPEFREEPSDKIQLKVFFDNEE